MTNETNVATAPEQEQSAKQFDFAKVDALRKHMLLTVESMVILLNTTRVSYYNWLKNGIKRKKNLEHVRKVVRSLVALVSEDKWPNPVVFVANQAERLKMLQDLLIELDKEPAT